MEQQDSVLCPDCEGWEIKVIGQKIIPDLAIESYELQCQECFYIWSMEIK